MRTFDLPTINSSAANVVRGTDTDAASRTKPAPVSEQTKASRKSVAIKLGIATILLALIVCLGVTAVREVQLFSQFLDEYRAKRVAYYQQWMQPGRMDE
jgi:hypothetical protein